MIVEAGFIYSIRHIPKGKRNAQTAWVADSTPVEIREATDAQAPVVCRLEVNTDFTDKPKRMLDRRYFDGRFWKPKEVPPYQAGQIERVTRERFVNTSKAYIFEDDGTPNWRRSEAVSLDDLAPCRFLESHEAKEREIVPKLHAKAADYLLVEDCIWTACPEPILKLARWSSQRHTYWDIEIVDASDVEADRSPDLYFRADRMKEAVAALKRRRREEKNPEDTGGPPKLQILRPEFFTFRYDIRPRVEYLARRAADTLKIGLAEAPVEQMIEYATLRDMLAADEVDHAALVDLLHGPVAERLGEDRWYVKDISNLRAEWDEWAEAGPALSEEDLAAVITNAPAA